MAIFDLLGYDDLLPSSFARSIEYRPKSMSMNVTNDRLEKMILPSHWLQKSMELLFRVFNMNDKGFVYDGATGDYSDPLQYPLYDESDFMIDNSTFMLRFAREPPYYLNHPSKEDCSVDISNIIPFEYLKNSAEIPLPHTDAENALRISQVDAELIERETWGMNLQSYEEMRSIGMKEMDGIYASDHIELRYAKTMYKSIRELEIKVIQSIYKRLKAAECYRDTLARYRNMTKELMYEKKDEWIRLNSKRKKKGLEEISFNEYNAKQKVRFDEQVALYYHRDYFSSPAAFCDGCVIHPPKDIQPSSSFVNGLSIRRWIGNEEVTQIYTTEKPWYPNATTPFGVTGIIAASWDRMFELKQMLTRWKGPLSAVFICKSELEQQAIDYLSKHFFPPRLSIILYVMKGGHPHYASFPINYLRNLAIVNIQTTHFMILDMDLRMTTNTYNEIKRIPEYILKSNRSAVILPIFFFNSTSILHRCTSVEDCAIVSNWYQPETKVDLAVCLHTLNCYSNKQLIRTHMYIMPEWYLARESSAVSRIRCFITDFMEPYFMVKYTPSLPLFDERFINYGYNKVQYFENIRQMGFVFYILNQAFAMDFPHPQTEFRKVYSNMVHTNMVNPMKLLYNEVQKQYSVKYAHVRNSRVCYLRQKSYYESIYSSV